MAGEVLAELSLALTPRCTLAGVQVLSAYHRSIDLTVCSSDWRRAVEVRKSDGSMPRVNELDKR